jgi:hypothetical protein
VAFALFIDSNGRGKPAVGLMSAALNLHSGMSPQPLSLPQVVTPQRTSGAVGL